MLRTNEIDIGTLRWHKSINLYVTAVAVIVFSDEGWQSAADCVRPDHRPPRRFCRHPTAR